MTLKTILLTTDLSETSKKAIEPALTLAEKFGAKILLVYVAELAPERFLDFEALTVEDMVARQQKQARQQLARFASENLPNGARVDLIIGLGSPHVEILRLAEEHRVDLIAMAPHGRGFISHAIVGSTTERVMRRAPCPVLVVRDSSAPASPA